jgi:hypothetical protein
MTKRERALKTIFGAGTTGDQALFIRTYVEARISYSVAIAEFRKGAQFAKFIATPDLGVEL